ncbi:MAG: glucosaminidase domain-containing protein [Synergistales bacterium]|nr:glucosaminidase domain-containing protein [Synergistales bacterium]
MWVALVFILGILSMMVKVGVEVAREEVVFVSPLVEAKTGPVTESERRDTTASVIDQYLRKKGSPLEGLGSVFYETAKENNLPVYLLPSIAMVESSGAKNFKKETYNFMGWGKGKIKFASFEDCIRTVGRKIATLPAYETFRKTGEIAEFCLAYNFPEVRSYCGKIRFFLEQFRNEEFLLKR